ncbi:MAG: hypothetical protein ABI432_17055 [Flavobacteriales bacterium]
MVRWFFVVVVPKRPPSPPARFWFRLVADSVWPSVLLHACHIILFGFYSRVLILPAQGNPRDFWLGESWIVFGTIPLMLRALLWWKRSYAVEAFANDARSYHA